MAIRRHEVIIVDVESTCWERNNVPEGQRSEIIEVGICTLNLKTRQPDNKRSIFTKPIASDISDFCTQLTTITPEMIAADGIDFAEACEIINKDYEADHRLWCSWGNYDRKMFIGQCEWRGIPYPFSDKHCNVKGLFGNLYAGNRGMASAMKKLGLELEGTHHRGDDDAWNIARILAYMLDEHGDDLLLSFW